MHADGQLDLGDAVNQCAGPETNLHRTCVPPTNYSAIARPPAPLLSPPPSPPPSFPSSHLKMGRPPKKRCNVALGKERANAAAIGAKEAVARAKHATEDRERDRRDEENRRAAKEGLVGVRSLSMFAVGLVVGKRKRTSTDSELDEEGRKKLHVLWVHRGERLFRQYIDRLRRLKAAKTKAAHSRVRGETLPDLVLPDWNFNECAADALHLAPRVVKVHWKAWQSARVKLVGERLNARYGKMPAKVLWFFPVVKAKKG